MDVLLITAQALLISVLVLFGLAALAFFTLLLLAGIPLRANRRLMQSIAPHTTCVHCGKLLTLQSLQRASDRAAAQAIHHRKFWFARFRMRRVDAICSCGTEYHFDPSRRNFVVYANPSFGGHLAHP